MDFDNYTGQDATGLASLVAVGDVSPREVLDAAVERADAVNPTLNAIVRRFEGRAGKWIASVLPEGPFRRVPFLLKDLTAALAGEPMSSGSRFDADYRPDYDHAMVERYRAAGLAPFAKTNCPE